MRNLGFSHWICLINLLFLQSFSSLSSFFWLALAIWEFVPFLFFFSALKWNQRVTNLIGEGREGRKVICKHSQNRYYLNTHRIPRGSTVTHPFRHCAVACYNTCDLKEMGNGRKTATKIHVFERVHMHMLCLMIWRAVGQRPIQKRHRTLTYNIHITQHSAITIIIMHERMFLCVAAAGAMTMSPLMVAWGIDGFAPGCWRATIIFNINIYTRNKTGVT